MTGAAGYVLRVNKDPYGDWFGAGDIWKEPVNPSQTIDIVPDTNYTYDVQGKKPGEIYPYSGCRAPFGEFSCPAPTPTPTPTATPTPGPWIKLKDSSYVSPRSLINRIPIAPVAYDGTDTNQPYFITGNSGVAMAPTVNVTGLNPAAKTGNPEYKANYTPAPYAMTPTAFLGYVRARKEHKTISSLNEITEDGLYIYQGNLNSVHAKHVRQFAPCAVPGAGFPRKTPPGTAA